MITTTFNIPTFTSANSSEKSLSKHAISQLLMLNKNTLYYGTSDEIEGDYDFENDEIYVDWEAISNHQKSFL